MARANMMGVGWKELWAKTADPTQTQGLPWSWARDDGVYVPRVKGDPWLYMVLPTQPLQWSDRHQRLDAGYQLQSLLADLGSTSRLPLGLSLPQLAHNRQVHILTVSIDVAPEVPEISTPAHRDFVQQLYEEAPFAPTKLFAIGVRLMPGQVLEQLEARERPMTPDQLLEVGRVLFRVPAADLEMYEQDLQQVRSVLFKHGGKPPTPRQRLLLESWYNRGEGNGALLQAHPTWVDVVDSKDRIELVHVVRFEHTQVQSSDFMWAAAAHSHPAAAATCISIRGELEPAAAFARRLRGARRRQYGRLQAQAEGDPLLDEAELEREQLQANAESMVKQEGAPILVNVSVVMARLANHQPPETYVDALRNRFGIVARPHWNQQVSALQECLPCYTGKRPSALHAMNLQTLAFAGLGSFGQLGDAQGIYLGRSDPDLSICWLDPWAAAAGTFASQAPGVAVLGQPGSGKTFAMQLMALQSALLGRTVIYINPKPQDNLEGMLRLVGQHVRTNLVQLGDATAEPGAFDPFRFAPPEYAYQIAALYIQDVFSPSMTDQQQVLLGQALQQAARAGVRSVGEAVRQFVHDTQLRDMILGFADSNSMFAMGIAQRALPDLRANRGLTLVQFDQGWPDVEEGRPLQEIPLEHRAALALLHLIPRAALEMLLRDRAGAGGDLYMDEAHRLLSSPAGRQFVNRQGREGRSQRVMPVLGTHLPSEIKKANLGAFMGRYLILMLQDREEAAVGLELAGLEATEARVDILGRCGPQAPGPDAPAMPARGIHRDLHLRAGGISIVPIPEHVRRLLSTSSHDVQQREALTLTGS